MLQQKAFARVTAVVLASGSPRRRELLQHVLPDGINFVVQPSSFAEDLPKGDDPAEYCAQTAFRKGEDVAKLIGDEAQLIISADTVVVADGNVLEKPRDAAHATEMLRTLSGATHRVVTGCALFRGGRRKSFYETTEVTFSELSDETIAAYVASGEPYDKAGGYGIQGSAGAFVSGISGCYHNVVGLPMNRLAREIAAFLDE
mmetsp:Transcript_290/g.822  ORF Transcript_290/g.822 Transcript_290/m.822 type:complete len:202 (+) Transcript_290:321-926(+)